MRANTYQTLSDLDAKAESWESLGRHHDDLLSPDITCSLMWVQCLDKTLLADVDIKVLAICERGATVGLLPYFVKSGVWAGLVKRDELYLATEANGGRVGLLASTDTHLETLLGVLLRNDAWDIASMTVTAGSASARAIVGFAHAAGLRVETTWRNSSPFIELAHSWEETQAKLAKKMRWSIRKSLRDLEELGELDYLHIHDPKETGKFIDCIYAIEHNSWKQEAGSAITTNTKERKFYEALIPRAAQEGVLSGHVLFVKGIPIAYILGLRSGPTIFLDLKESFDQDYSKYSPGNALKRFAIETLIADGVTTYDFMGNCEPYKMKWTNQTYAIETYVFFNRTWRGRFSSLQYDLASVFKEFRVKLAN